MESMKWYQWLFLVSLLILAGCGFFEGISGVENSDTSGASDGSYAAGKAVSSLISSFIPWIGVALGAGGTIYNHIRKKRIAEGLASVVRGVNIIRTQRDEKGNIDLNEEALIRVFRAVQDRDGTRQEVRKVIAKVENTGA